ncbi:hypothetical protein BDW69DRAFT_117591 [Aspergillus filifer]
MVVNAPNPGPGGVKRPLSSTQDICAEWESASPMGAPLRSPLNLPFPHYALIYYDNKGKIRVKESSSIEEQGCSVITADVREKFLELIGPKIGYQKPLLRASAVSRAHAHDLAYHRNGKRRKASPRDPALEMSFSEQYAEPILQIPSPPANYVMTSIEVGDSRKVEEYYLSALVAFQQYNCRTMCKAFIKVIEDRKQVNYPYNGGPTKEPEKTKPRWWPWDVQHKEPDHLKKDERLKLMIHLISKPTNPGITANKLHEIARDNKRSLKPEKDKDEKWEILDEIFKVRKMQEKFERGEVDASTRVYVRKRVRSKDSDEVEEVVENTEAKLEVDDFEDVKEDQLFTSSSENLPSFASVDPLALQTRSFSMSNDRSQPFPVSDSLSFGEPSRQARSYYPTPADYTDDYSQPMMRPAVSGLVSPNEHTGFDYLSHTPFTASATGDHSRSLTMPMQQVGHYDWEQPFRPNMYNSMQYGAGPVLAQNAMLPMSPHAHDLSNTHGLASSHGLPDLTRERPSHMDFLSGRPAQSF